MGLEIVENALDSISCDGGRLDAPKKETQTDTENLLSE
jgi:hypothetical protein